MMKTAELDWHTVDGIDVPVSKQFGDVYFSKANGLLEARHVFLQGNDLAERLGQLQDDDYFCVAETGFGTGLNFLVLWQLWQQVRPNNNSRLHFISTEKYPLSRADLRKALATWTELSAFSDALLQQYPLPLAGVHRLRFDAERVSLDLWFGDANDSLGKIRSLSKVDAWFLDGFAPSCNPDLWQPTIFEQMIRLSGYQTTFASFSVAGILKRGLAEHGIRISRPKGFAHKREMLKAIDLHQGKLQKFPPKPNIQQFVIIGAGIAGLTLAWTLAQRGFSIKIVEKENPIAGASGNPYALLNPKLCKIEQIETHLMMQAWQYAMRFYQPFEAARKIDIIQLYEKNPSDVAQMLADYPIEIAEWRQSIAQSDFPASVLKNSFAIAPKVLAQQILQHQKIELVIDEVLSLEKIDENWQIKGQKHNYKASHVVFCNALAAQHFIPDVQLKAIRGQVSWTRVNDTAEYQTSAHVAGNTAYSYGGYAMMLDDKTCLFGASFVPNDDDQSIRTIDHQHNLSLMQHALPHFAQRIPQNVEHWQGRTSLRAQSKDYFPLVGGLGQGLFIFSGLGSKGFLFAPLCAEILSSEILQQHFPVVPDILQMLRPLRFKR